MTNSSSQANRVTYLKTTIYNSHVKWSNWPWLRRMTCIAPLCTSLVWSIKMNLIFTLYQKALLTLKSCEGKVGEYKEIPVMKTGFSMWKCEWAKYLVKTHLSRYLLKFPSIHCALCTKQAAPIFHSRWPWKISVS